MNKKYIISGLIGGVVFLAIAAAVVGGRYYIIKHKIEQQHGTAVESPTVDAESEGVVLTSSNYPQVKQAILDRIETSKKYSYPELYYKVSFNTIYKTQLETKDVYFGTMNFLFGDMSTSTYQYPFLIVDGKIYGTNSYSNELYPYDQVQWKQVTKTGILYHVIPLEETLPSVYGTVPPTDPTASPSNELLETFTINYDIQGKPIKVIAKSVLSSIESKGPFVQVNDQSDLLDKNNQYSKNPIDNQILLAGRPAGKQLITFKQTYNITYPASVNSIPVTYQYYNQGTINESITFGIDDGSNQSYATMYCSPYRSPESGQKTGDMPALDAKSQSKVIDWGIQKSVGGQQFSFTTDYEHCEFNISGLFRYSMFSINLP